MSLDSGDRSSRPRRSGIGQLSQDGAAAPSLCLVVRCNAGEVPCEGIRTIGQQLRDELCIPTAHRKVQRCRAVVVRRPGVGTVSEQQTRQFAVVAGYCVMQCGSAEDVPGVCICLAFEKSVRDGWESSAVYIVKIARAKRT